jgi:hypothetical protein
VACWITAGAALSACIPPDDQRPGLWLGASSAESFATDWSFTEAHREVALEVQTPYWIPHSVTIWCVSVDGDLFIAARDPDTKRWPGWVAERNDVRLGIGEEIYEGRATQITDEETVAALRAAYQAKYELPPRAEGEGPPMRYWRVVPRG